MDKFVKNALLLCLLISILILCMSFAGTELLGQQFQGADEKVQNLAGQEDRTSILSVPLNHDLEPALFSIMSAVGGFICGFLYVEVFYNKGNAHG